MISWERIDELSGEVGPESFHEVVELFLIEVDEVIARLRQNAGAPVNESDLHFLRGCALNLGFRALSNICVSGGPPVTGAEVAGVYDNSRKAFLHGIESGLRAA